MFQETLETFQNPEKSITERNLGYIAEKLGGEISDKEIKDLLKKIENSGGEETIEEIRKIGRMFLLCNSPLQELPVGKYVIEVAKGNITSFLQISQDISGWENRANPNIDSIKY